MKSWWTLRSWATIVGIIQSYPWKVVDIIFNHGDTVTLEIWPVVKVMTHPWVIGNNHVDKTSPGGGGVNTLYSDEYNTYIALLEMVGVKTKFGMPVNSVTPVATPADGTSVHGIWFGTLCCHDAPRPGTRPNGMWLL